MSTENRSARIGSAKARGFAAMDPARRAEICAKGGRTAHANGRAHQFTSEEAREAGKAGGAIVSRDRKHMAEIGAAGGRSSGGARRRNASTTSAHKTATPEP